MGDDINRVIIFVALILGASVARHREAIAESVLVHASERSVLKTTWAATTVLAQERLEDVGEDGLVKSARGAAPLMASLIVRALPRVWSSWGSVQLH